MGSKETKWEIELMKIKAMNWIIFSL